MSNLEPDKPEPLDLAKVAKDSSGPDRWRLALGALRQNLCIPPQRTKADILAVAYDGEACQYWQAVLAEVISVYDFADVLAVHLVNDEVEAKRKDPPPAIGRGDGGEEGAHEEDDDQERAAVHSGQIEQWGELRIPAAMIRCERWILHVAASEGKSFFIGDTAALLVRGLDWLSMKRVKLRPRDAAEWLLGNPNRRHLVPASLAAYLAPKVVTKSPAQLKPKATSCAPRSVSRSSGASRASAMPPTISSPRPTAGLLRASIRPF
jgi:hypothetical protein